MKTTRPVWTVEAARTVEYNYEILFLTFRQGTQYDYAEQIPGIERDCGADSDTTKNAKARLAALVEAQGHSKSYDFSGRGSFTIRWQAHVVTHSDWHGASVTHADISAAVGKAIARLDNGFYSGLEPAAVIEKLRAKPVRELAEYSWIHVDADISDALNVKPARDYSLAS